MSNSAGPVHVGGAQILEHPRLLESELMGLRLHELIAALANDGNGPRHARQGKLADTALADVLRDYEAEVLDRGLCVLPGSRLQMLLDQPSLLLKLQGLLLGRGGAYWDRVTEALPDASHLRLSEAQWQERLGRTFARKPKAALNPRSDQATPLATRVPPKPALTKRWRGPLAALLFVATVSCLAAGWYRAEARLAAARQQHADDAAALRQSFDERLAGVQRTDASERVAAYCRLLHELSSLPAAEQLVSLPTDTLPSNADSLPPDEELATQQEQLPSVEESLVSPSAREQAIARVVNALRHDAATWAELTRDARRYLEHPDFQVGHGAAMIFSDAGFRKTDN